MHYYQHNIAAWAYKTSHLTLEEESIYRKIVDFYLLSESPIPKITDSVIRRLSLGLHSELFNNILVEFFVERDGFWHSDELDEMIFCYKKRAKANSENGKNGGRPRKIGSEETENKPTGLFSLNETKANEKAIKNKELRINNQELIIKNKEPIKKQTRENSRFETFWKAYPKKVSKGTAEKAFAKIDADENLLFLIMLAIDNQKNGRKWTDDHGQYIPNPATWLNGKCWEDEVEPVRMVQNQVPEKFNATSYVNRNRNLEKENNAIIDI